MIMENKIPFTVILIHICTDFLKTMKPFEMMQFKQELNGWQFNAVQMLPYKTQDGTLESLSCQ